MIRPLLYRLIEQQEKNLEAPLPYLRDLADTTPAGFLKFGLIAPLGLHRRALPLEAWHIARVTAAFLEDCGTCAQIAITLARRDGVRPELLRAAITDQADELPEPLRNICVYLRALHERRDADDLRRRIRKHYGQAAVVELALVAGVARVIPTIKRALGYAQACRLLRFDFSDPAGRTPAPATS